MNKLTLGLKDKYGEELFAGDSVQIVKGAKSGSVLHDIKAVPKVYTIVGEVLTKDGRKESIQVAAKKVMKVKAEGTRSSRN